MRAMQPAPAPALRTDWALALYSALLILVASADAVVRPVGVERHAVQCGNLLERVRVRDMVRVRAGARATGLGSGPVRV